MVLSDFGLPRRSSKLARHNPFGTTAVTGAATTNAFDYTGRETDGTGLKYYRARYYHPGLQRFISEDPIGLHGGDLNLYAYVQNRPTMFNDPLGLWCPNCHYRQTLEVALTCGLSAKTAEALAQATKEVDYEDLVETLKSDSAQHGMPGSKWREFAASRLDAAITGEGEAAITALGHGVHAIQDPWAHDLRSPQGTIKEHLRRRRGDPDDPAKNPWEWEMSRRATMDYIASFMRGRGKEPQCGYEP